MSRRIREGDLQAVEGVVRRHPDGLAAQQIADALQSAPPRRTLQYRLKYLVDHKRLVMEGDGRGARYRSPTIAAGAGSAAGRAEARGVAEVLLPLSESGVEIQAHVRLPSAAREPVGYDRSFLHSYRPNDSSYLSPAERGHLREIGTPRISEQPAGTYARQILNRLLIDLSWNSSRLEGNTYSLLDTKRLLETRRGGRRQGTRSRRR